MKSITYVKPLLFLPLFILGSCASKNDFFVVQDDVRKLKTEAETIKSQSAVSYADIQQVRDEVTRLRGTLEESEHKNNNSFSRLTEDDSLLVAQVGSIESRLQKLEQNYATLAQELKKKEVLPLPPPVPQPVEQPAPLVSDVVLLNVGSEKLSQHNDAVARESFSALLKNYPKSPLLDQAQFLLAESFFDEKKYENAILEYQVVIAKYTNSLKRPAALYKQGLAFELIGDSVNAKARFKDLLAIYGKTPEAALAKKKLK